MSFPGINARSVKSTSRVFAWCEKEINQMCAVAPPDLHSLFVIYPCFVKYTIGASWRYWYQLLPKYVSSINELYGDYILISDNFGLEIFGIGGKLEAPDQYKWILDEEKKSKMQKFHSEYYQKSLTMRDHFCKVINAVVASNPRINFLLRPHPVADPLYWHSNLHPALTSLLYAATVLSRG